MASSPNIPVKIEFLADAGNVDEVTQDIQKDLSDLGKNQFAPIPGMVVDLEVNPEQLRQQIEAAAPDVPPLEFDALLNTEKVQQEIEEVKRTGSFQLPPIEWAPSSDIARITQELENLRVVAEHLATTELNQVRDQLDAVLHRPDLAGQAQGYASIVGQLERWRDANSGVLASNQAIRAQFQTLAASARAGLQEVADRSQQLAQLGAEITGGFAGVATMFGGLAVGALAVAANFEQLRAKLISVTGSVEEANEKFEFARQFAPQTPFDVRGLIDATAVIESFQLKSEQLLPVAANLAAAMGKDLREATLALSKAASGSAEGFESLRDEYGITTKHLEAAGAVVDKATGQLSHLEKDINRNREALVKLIQARFGDAIARQSATLTGALSNVGDAAQNVAASFGETILPIATLGAKALSGLLNMVAEIPAPLKLVAAAGTVFVAGVAGMAAAAAGGVTALLLLQGQLAALAADVPLAATGLRVVSGALAGVQTAAVGARAALVALATNPLTLALLGIGTAATAAALAINEWEKAELRAGEAVAKSTRSMAAARNNLRNTVDLINLAGQSTGVQVDLVGDKAAQIKKIQEAFDKITPEQFALAMDKAGVSVEELKNRLQESGKQVTDYKAQLAAATKELQILEMARDFQGVQVYPETLQKIEELREKVKQLSFWLREAEKSAAAAQGSLDALAKLDARLKPLSDEAKALGPFLDLSKQVGSTNSLNNGLALTNELIKKIAADAAIGTTDVDALLQKLRGLGDGPATAQQRQTILDLIGLLQQRADFEKAIQAEADRAGKAEQDRLEREFRLQQITSQSKLHDELAFVQQRLKAAQEGSEEYVQLKEREAALIKAIHDRMRQDEEKARQAADEALSFFDEATSRAAEAFSELSADQLKDGQAARLEALNTVIQRDLSEAISSGEKLNVLEAARIALTRELRAGTIEYAAAMQQIEQIDQQILQTERAISEEKRNQQNQTASLALQNMQQELQILEARKQNGEAVEEELAAKRQEIFQQQLDQIEREKQAAIEAHRGQADAILEIEKQAQLKRQALENAETLRKLQELGKQEKAQQSSLDKQVKQKQQADQKLAQADKNRLGGARSPLRSIQDSFSSLASLGDFSLGEFSLATTRPTPAPRRGPATFRTQQAEQMRTNFDPIKDKAPQQAVASGGSNVYHTNFQGIKVSDAELEKLITRVVERAIGAAKMKGRAS